MFYNFEIVVLVDIRYRMVSRHEQTQSSFIVVFYSTQ